MADAAKSARGAFQEIKSGSGEMGAAVGSSTGSARQGVMLLGEEFGVHLPRGITTFISSLGPVGAAMEAAFPFIAIIVGATLLIQHLAKLREEGQKLTQDQMAFGTAVQVAFNSLDQKLISAQIRTDELRNDHMGALRHELELIDKQSMAELVQQFGLVQKAADSVFADLKTSWYQSGIGSEGAKHALEGFQTQYDSLLAQGKKSEATDLLKGTKGSAERVLAAMNATKGGGTLFDDGSAEALKAREERERNLQVLKDAGVGSTQKEVQAQQVLVDALNSQLTIEGKVAALKNQDQTNAKLTTGKEVSGLGAEAAREAAEHAQKMGDLQVSGERATANALLDIKEASIAERLASDLAFAARDRVIQEAADSALIGALDKSGKDYANQKKALQDRELEHAQEYANLTGALTAKAQLDGFRKELTDLEQSEREKIDATDKGSSARLAAIDAALKEEQSRNLQNTNFYRELAQQRIQTVREAAEEEAKLTAEAGRESADNQLKTGELALAAQREHQSLMNSAQRVTAQMRMQQEVQAANAEYALKMTAAAQDIAALDKTGKDYENKLREQNDKQRQLTIQHENEITAIKDKAEIERNQKVISAELSFNDTVTAGLTQVLMGHKSFAAEMTSIGDQVASGMLQNALKTVEANLLSKESDSAKAARDAYKIGIGIGGPAGMILAPVFAAVAFSTVSGFAEGTDMVPGVTRGDTIPAMLTPGEGVVPGGVMDGLRAVARNGGFDQQRQMPMIHAPFSPKVSAMDATGVDAVLTKHHEVFQRHLENTLRRMNH